MHSHRVLCTLCDQIDKAAALFIATPPAPPTQVGFALELPVLCLNIGLASERALQVGAVLHSDLLHLKLPQLLLVLLRYSEVPVCSIVRNRNTSATVSHMRRWRRRRWR
jgi:hypothetical protein